MTAAGNTRRRQAVGRRSTPDRPDMRPLIPSDGADSFIYGRRRPTVEQINNTTGAVLYLHHDQQGSTRLITGSTGKVEGKCTYSAYGTPTCEGTTTTPLGYDGQYTSSDTGLIYLRNRVYDPATAQFLSVDPLAAITRAPYTYAGDNPINEADPTGLCNADPLSGSFWTKGNCISESPLNPIPYYEKEISSYENGCGYFASVASGLEGAGVGALDVSGAGEEAGLGDVAAGTLSDEDVVGAAERWLGEGYEEIAPGVYRSADGTRQFRMTDSDLGAANPHVHFESVGPGGSGNTENAHVNLGEW
jgi:RHS repeat-associated protein